MISNFSLRNLKWGYFSDGEAPWELGIWLHFTEKNIQIHHDHPIYPPFSFSCLIQIYI